MKSLPLIKRYGGRTVLDVPEITLPDGRITVLLGANGSGKSTYARILAGVLQPEKGMRPFAENVSPGFLPQKPYAFHMSTGKNLDILPGDPAWKRELAERLGLAPLLETKASGLSGGETARMALARLLARPFDLLILDEPCAAMDMEYTAVSEELLRAYRDRFGAAVLLITHSIGQAKRVGEELLFFREGRLAEAGPCGPHMEDPETEEWKTFLEFYG